MKCSHQILNVQKNKQLRSTKNLKIHYLNAIEFAHTPIIPSLYKELMKISNDSIVHVHIAQAYIPEIVYQVCKRKRVPYIAHIRMDVRPSSFIGKLILSPYKIFFLKKILKNAVKIIVLNKDYSVLIQEKYNIPKKKIKIIPNATNFRVMKLKIFSKGDKLKFLAVGNLELQKNYLNLIKAISLLPKKVKGNLILNVAGEGPQKKKISDLIRKLDLEKNILLHGRIEGKELENLYKESDLFLLPSYAEGFSTVLLEAMSKGLPIITSNVLGNRSVIKDNYNGYLCDTNYESIAKIIIKMIKNRNKWKTFSKNNIKEVKKYSWDKIVKQTEDVYREVLKENALKNKI